MWLRRLLAVLLILAGLGLGLISLFGALMIAVPPVKPPEGVQPDCCLQYTPLLLLIPVAVLFAFGFSAHCLWRGYYPVWNKNWQNKLLIAMHAVSVLLSLAVLWVWLMGVLLV